MTDRCGPWVYESRRRRWRDCRARPKAVSRSRIPGVIAVYEQEFEPAPQEIGGAAWWAMHVNPEGHQFSVHDFHAFLHDWWGNRKDREIRQHLGAPERSDREQRIDETARRLIESALS